MKKMNLPNKLTVLRLCLVPVLIIFGMLPESVVPWYISYPVCGFLFIGTAVTDMLDGKIARKYNLITDFGKFLDPVADKVMVIGAMFVILYKFDNLRTVMVFALLIVVFRELAITSMRLVVSTGQNIVVAANKLGKLKTVLQTVAIATVFLEPMVQLGVRKICEAVKGETLAWRTDIIPLTWVTLGLSIILTVWSGVAYLKAYWKYLDPEN